MTIKEFNHTVDIYSDNIYRFILKNIRKEDKAKDVVQETFEKLWLNRDKIGKGKEKQFLFKVAYNTMIDMIRKEKKIVEIKEADFTTLKHNEQYSDIKEILDKAVKQLPNIQRTVILLRDYEGYSYKEIGEITELTESQVKVYIYRARNFLKKYIGSYETVI